MASSRQMITRKLWPPSSERWRRRWIRARRWRDDSEGSGWDPWPGGPHSPWARAGAHWAAWFCSGSYPHRWSDDTLSSGEWPRKFSFRPRIRLSLDAGLPQHPSGSRFPWPQEPSGRSSQWRLIWSSCSGWWEAARRPPVQHQRERRWGHIRWRGTIRPPANF